jgi:hypothetical protein
MIKRHEDAEVPVYINPGAGSWNKLSQEGNNLKVIKVDGTIYNFSRSENNLTSLGGGFTGECLADGRCILSNGRIWTFNTNRVKWSMRDCSEKAKFIC